MVCLLICEFMIINTVFAYLFQREHAFSKSLFRIFVDAFIIYLIMVMMPGVHIKGFLIAFLISLAVYLFDFIGNEVNDFIKTRKKNMKQD
jgi:hypothetical protein